MSMSDRIDPGPGWRLLGKEPIIERGDQFSIDGKSWHSSLLPTGAIGSKELVYRRRVRITEPRTARTIKGIATRATVRVVAADGEVERSIRCDSGLSVDQMYSAIASFDGAVDALRNRTSVPKYIMLEIQRGENDC